MPDTPAAEGVSTIKLPYEAVWDGLVKFIATVGKLITELQPQYSTPMMIVFLLILFASLVYFMIRMEKGQREVFIKPISVYENMDALKKSIEEANLAIEKKNAELNSLRNNPHYSADERFYFNINGIVNSILFACVALLFLSYHTANGACAQKMEGLSALVIQKINQKAKNDIISKAGELCASVSSENYAHTMSALAVAAGISSVLIFMMPKQDGRSIQIMNRSTMISGIISVLIIIAAFILNPEFASTVRASWQ